MKFTINKLCHSCNKDFELKAVYHNGMTRASYANFEDCPHCGERNDHWIKVDWPDDNFAADEKAMEAQRNKNYDII